MEVLSKIYLSVLSKLFSKLFEDYIRNAASSTVDKNSIAEVK